MARDVPERAYLMAGLDHTAELYESLGRLQKNRLDGISCAMHPLHNQIKVS